ncbi:uncharacterized protein LOC126278872 [Schistocerca gregaria]|uniref:uncharacterized protein LOC126278872 n=1 Tax=Schistocerca gregaria TaxID=7010 RepID=UPI00211E8626|nr:uncharacterized protein LOC126278872 [Schistocerca gregaria]
MEQPKVSDNVRFLQLNKGKCVFHALTDDTGVYLALYVDDGLLGYNEYGGKKVEDPSELVSVRNRIEEKLLELVDIDEARKNDLRQILVKHAEVFSDQPGLPNFTPFDVGTKLHSRHSSANQHEVKEMERKPYRQAVSSLMFSATVSWPDIMFAVSMVSRILHKAVSIIGMLLKGL